MRIRLIQAGKILGACVLQVWFASCAKDLSDGITPGVTDTEIVLGSSSALEGHARFLGTQYARGSQAYFNSVNAEGGVFGRKVRLITLDDGYDRRGQSPIHTFS